MREPYKTQHVEIPKGFESDDVLRPDEPESFHRPSSARVNRDHDREGHCIKEREGLSKAVRRIDIHRPVNRGCQVLLRYAETDEPLLAEVRERCVRGVDHHISYEGNSFDDALLGEICNRGLCGAEEKGGDVIGENTVDLFGHLPAPRPEASFNVSNGDVELRCSECSSKSRIRVPIYQDALGRDVQHHRFERFEHATRLETVAARTDTEINRRGGE